MRKKHILLAILMVMPMLLTTSCLKDQEDVFDKSSSARMSEYLKSYDDLLKSAENGWALEYYAGFVDDVKYGGWVYALKFNGSSVDVYSDNAADPTKPVSSLYKMTNDDGPVLAFDTYNELMHLFSTPDPSNYEAYGGDHEFIIMGVNDAKTEITLKGKRSGFTMYLRKLDKAPADYMTNIMNMEEKINLANFIGSGAGANLDYDYHSIFLGPEDMYNRYVDNDVTMSEDEINEFTRMFIMTETGIRLYSPVTINGKEVQNLVYDAEKRTFTCTDAGAEDIKLSVFIPEGYNEWAGEYDLTCEVYISGKYVLQTNPVTIEPVGDGMTLNLKGLNPNYDVKLQFNRQSKQVEILPQKLGAPLPNGNVAFLAAWDTTQGYVQYTVGGVITKWNEAQQMWQLVDNGRWAGYNVDGFILYEFDKSVSTRIGALGTDYSAWFILGGTRLAEVGWLKKR